MDALENLSTEAKVQMGVQSFDAGNSVNCKLSRIQKSLNELQSNQAATFHFEDECCRDESKERKPQSTQFLLIQTKQLIRLQDALERHCKVLSVFEVKNYNDGVNFVNIYFPYLSRKVVPSQ